jgi:hypothetical protein
VTEPKHEKVEKPAEHQEGQAAGVGPEGRAVGGAQVSDAQKARTNASDGSLRKYNAAAQEHSIELVSDDKVVSRNNALKEKDLAAPHAETSAPHVERSTARAEHKETSVHHDPKHESTSLKKLKDDTAANIEDPRLKQEFRNNLEHFQARTDIDQAEKDRVYMQLSRLLTATDTKLVGIDTNLVRKDGHIDSIDKNLSALEAAEKDALRVSLAEGLIYHAAHPSRVDQGNFNTCNVSTLAERVFTRHPSIAAEMAVTTAIKGEWVNPGDGARQVIKIDRESLKPAEFGADNVPPVDGHRSFDIQLLNVVMINDYWQHEVPPKKYIQTKPSKIRDEITGKTIQDYGEHLYDWDAKHDKCLAPVTRTVETSHGEIQVPCRSPHMTGQAIAEEGACLTNESHFVIINSPPKIDRRTGQPIDDGMVHVTSPDMLRKALIEMKAQGRFPAVITVDAHSAIFERTSDSKFDPHSGHVVSIRDYDDSNGRTTISNQWGSKFDIKVNLSDLYDASAWNEMKTGDWRYELEKWKVQQFGNIEAAKDS